jgi:CheY-like chemotaxis protein
MLLQSRANSAKPSPALSTTQIVALEAAKTPKTILLADDDENSPLLVGLALEPLKPRPILQHVPNAFQAKDYLLGNLRFKDRLTYGFPDLVLLDLKMPIMDGFQFLEWARSKAEFKRLLIVVLTDALNQRDLSRAYQLGATSFLLKPNDTKELAGPLKVLLQL